MRRRDVFPLIGGAVAAWPLGARAQQPDRPKRIGFLSNTPADAQGQSGLAEFRETLQQLGWSDSNNVRIDVRWGENDGNTTGFMNFEYSLSGKWLELLKQVAPQVTRALVLRDAASPAGNGEFGALQAAAPAVGMELRPVDTRDAAAIERAVAAFASNTNTGGMIVTPSATVSGNRELIVELAAKHKLPAVYPYRYMVTSGGLIAYGPDPIDMNRRAAGYVDRILKGEKPADLPVQAPTKFALVINLKCAKALGLTVPPSLLASADEVIE